MSQQMERFKIAILDDDREDWIDRFKGLLEKEFPTAEIEIYKNPDDFFDLEDYEVEADVILLDVLGMDPWVPKLAIPTIRRRWPKVPVIMLSKKEELSDALTYFALGAQGYIIKKIDTAQNARMMFGNIAHQAEIIKDWGKAASLIKFLVNEYRPVKKILDDEHDIGWVRKTGDSPVIPAQVKFLQNIHQRKNPVLSELFPRILRPRAKSYDIPFYRAKSLRRTLFEMSDPDEIVKTAQTVLKSVLRELKTHLFDYRTHQLTKGEYEWYIDEYYIGKLQRRQDELRELLENSEMAVETSNRELLNTLNRAQEKVRDSKFAVPKDKNVVLGLLEDMREIVAPSKIAQREALLDVLNAKQLKIGGKTMEQPMVILKSLLKNEKGKKKFLPKKIGQIHGDLHFDNILVDMAVPEKPFIKLIDPRGFTKGADFAYDVGKLLHSCHGKYDMIDAEYCSIPDTSGLVRKTRAGIAAISAPEQVEWVRERQGGGSRDTVTSYGRKIEQGHYDAFDRIERWLVDGFLPELFPEDAEWKSRSYLNEALHFCTMGPFHLERNPLKSLTLYVQGVQLMNRLSDNLGSQL